MKLCRTCGAPMDDEATFCPMCGSKYEKYSSVADNDINISKTNIIDEKPKWYEKLFNTYVRIIFFRFSIGSFLVFIITFTICMGITILISNSKYTIFNDNAFSIASFISVIVPIIITVIVNKKVKEKRG